VGSRHAWESTRRLQQKSGLKGQGFNHQLVAAFRRKSRDAGHQVVNDLQFFRRRRDQDAFEAVLVFFPGDILVHQYRQRHFADYARWQVRLFNGAAGLIGDVFRGAGGFVGAAVGTGGGPRKSGSGSRDTVGNRPPRVVFGALRREHDAARGVEDLLAQLRARKIALHRHAGAEFLGPEEWTEGGADLGDKVGFDLVPVVERRGGRPCAVQGGRGFGAAKEIAVHVQQGHRVGRQAFDRTGHQVGDGDHVLRREAGTRLDLDQHAGFGGLLGLKKYGFLGEGQVDASLLHFGQSHHGALQFALESAPIVHVFGEFGGAEIHLIEQLEADASGLGQTDGGHGEPQFGQARGGHQYGASVLGQAVVGAGFLQFLHDAGGILRRQAGEEGAKIAFLAPLHQRIEAGAYRNRDHHDGEALPYGEVRQNLAHELDEALGLPESRSAERAGNVSPTPAFS